MIDDMRSKAEADFRRARLRAFLRELLSLVSGRPNELLPFAEVEARLKIRSRFYKGVREVPLDKIVGSLGRYRDFDRAFLPTQSHTRNRWEKVAQAYYEGVELPPVKLYQVGEIYFVVDGHHRVSVARERGDKYIRAEVIECQSRVPVTPDLTIEDLVIKGEYAEFLEETSLDQLRPEQRIEFTIPGNYRILLEHISVHRYFLGLERKAPVSWEEAVVSWYDNLYQPLVELIRRHGVLKEFPGRTEADLYVWIMDHLYFLRERYGPELSPEEAVLDFAQEFSQRPSKKAWREVKQALEDLVTEMPMPVTEPDEGISNHISKALELVLEETEEENGREDNSPE